jgi:GNAT superfamily N-acetyltransferase
MSGRERVVEAIEANAAETLMEMGRVGGGEQREDGRVRWSIGGSPIDYHNCVVAAGLDAGEADQAIAESLDRMRAHGVPGSWHVGPSMRPADLGARLLAAGFTEGGSEPGMAAGLQQLPALDPPEGLWIATVATTQELKVWSDTLAQGFGEGEREATWVGSVFGRIGFGTGRWQHYLAYLDGEPVATSTLHVAAGVAGVYFVMTVPEARRRGIGAAVTLAAMRGARDLGVELAVLGSSPAGRSVYASLGFDEYCTIELYEWKSRA